MKLSVPSSSGNAGRDHLRSTGIIERIKTSAMDGLLCAKYQTRTIECVCVLKAAREKGEMSGAGLRDPRSRFVLGVWRMIVNLEKNWVQTFLLKTGMAYAGS